MQRGCGDTIPANRLRDESRSSLRDVPGVSAKCVPLNAAPLCANESAKFHVYKGEVTELNSEKLIHPWVLDGFLTSYQRLGSGHAPDRRRYCIGRVAPVKL